MIGKKKSQIWIEVVVYTLIGLSIITLLLAVVKPKIERARDKATIEQTIEILKYLDSKINDVKFSGETRPVEMKIGKGILSIIPEENRIDFSMESTYKYSELNRTIFSGNIAIETTEGYNVLLSIAYDNYNITYNGDKERHDFQEAAVPYKLLISNIGSENNKINIDIKEIS